MAIITKEHIKKLKKIRGWSKYLCKAPFVSMKISIDGRVSPCCYNKEMDDLYPERTLSQIWNGDVFESYRKQIKKNILPSGCRNCENAILNHEYHSVKIHQYNRFRAGRNKLRIIELAMDNACNLECIMCNGRHSSSIRKNVEKLQLQESVFSEKIVNEIKEFIPTLEQFVFAGGEPFLIQTYYRIWEDIIRINPSCEISVVTNGTVLTDKIKDVLSRGKFRINLSLDAVDKEVYEMIRVKANFEAVLENVEFFGNYMRKQNGHLHIPVCPLKVNRYNIPDVVKFCNKNKYTLNFVHINGAFDTALWGLGSEELSELKSFYLSQNFEIIDDFDVNNVSEFTDLVKRLDKWIENSIIKEKYEDFFDLKTDRLEELKRIFYSEIALILSENYKHRKMDIYKMEEFKNNFEILMNCLPAYFQSNHFYERLGEISKSVIIEGVLNMPIKVMQEKAKEIFFFGFNH